MAEIPSLANQQGTGHKPKNALGNLLVQYKSTIKQAAREERKAQKRRQRNGHTEPAATSLS